MILGFGNNVVSSLASDITASQTTFSVLPGDGPLFAALLTSDFNNKSTSLKNYAKITLTDSGETAFEVCHLTAVNGDTLTVIRGQEGTAAKGWSLKDVVANFATRGSENAFPQIAHIQSGFYTSGTAGGTANALTLELPTTFFLNGSVDWVLKTPIVVYPIQNNTGAATLQLTMGGRVLGTFPLYKGNKAALVSNDILKDVALVCLMDSTKSFLTILNPGGIYSSFVPITRKVNGHGLSTDVDVLPGDIFKLSTGIGDAADLNTYTAPGLYYQPANAQATTGKNYPETVAGSLEVYKHAGITQIYRTYNNSRCYIRTLYSGAWTAWTKQYDTANKPTPAEIGALASNGNAVSATKLQTARTIGGVAFDGTANINLPGVNIGGNQSTTGNAATATRLQTARTIAGVSFNGTANIAIPAGNVGAYTKAESDGRFQPKGNYTPTGTAYTKAESDARYGIVNLVRRGGQQIFNSAHNWIANWESPAGCVVTGVQQNGADDGRKMGFYYRQLQYLNKQTGAWVNIGD
ncbi:phage tail protein [Enterobacter hormaechei]